MNKKKSPKEGRYLFRFSNETVKRIDWGVAKLKRKFRAMDRTKFLEYLVDTFWDTGEKS